MSQIALAAYHKSGASQPALALAVDGTLYDLDDARKAGIKLDASWSNGISAVLAHWNSSPQAVKNLGDEIRRLAWSKTLAPVANDAANLTAPFRPERIYCAASNYIEHANEMGTVLAGKAESKPYMFIKLSNTVIGPNETILMPPETSQLDWEIELAAVIGKPGRAHFGRAGPRSRRRIFDRQRHLRAGPERPWRLSVQVRLVPGKVPRHVRTFRPVDRSRMVNRRSAGGQDEVERQWPGHAERQHQEHDLDAA